MRAGPRQWKRKKSYIQNENEKKSWISRDALACCESRVENSVNKEYEELTRACTRQLRTDRQRCECEYMSIEQTVYRRRKECTLWIRLKRVLDSFGTIMQKAFKIVRALRKVMHIFKWRRGRRRRRNEMNYLSCRRRARRTKALSVKCSATINANSKSTENVIIRIIKRDSSFCFSVSISVVC